MELSLHLSCRDGHRTQAGPPPWLSWSIQALCMTQAYRIKDLQLAWERDSRCSRSSEREEQKPDDVATGQQMEKACVKWSQHRKKPSQVTQRETKFSWQCLNPCIQLWQKQNLLQDFSVREANNSFIFIFIYLNIHHTVWPHLLYMYSFDGF